MATGAMPALIFRYFELFPWRWLPSVRQNNHFAKNRTATLSSSSGKLGWGIGDAKVTADRSVLPLRACCEAHPSPTSSTHGD